MGYPKRIWRDDAYHQGIAGYYRAYTEKFDDNSVEFMSVAEARSLQNGMPFSMAFVLFMIVGIFGIYCGHHLGKTLSAADVRAAQQDVMDAAMIKTNAKIDQIDIQHKAILELQTQLHKDVERCDGLEWKCLNSSKKSSAGGNTTGSR